MLKFNIIHTEGRTNKYKNNNEEKPAQKGYYQ